MRRMKRWGVMTLVALLVLASMGAALADDSVETEEPTTLPEQGTYQYELVDDLVSFVFYWGFGESVADPVCESDESTEPVGSSFGFTPGDEAADTAGDCFLIPVEGPNGQVNHGTMVSSFVHWLKGADLAELAGFEDMPKGQMIKKLAHDDFGKGFYEFDDLEGEDPELAEEDGHGPPDHVIAKKAEKAQGPKK